MKYIDLKIFQFNMRLSCKSFLKKNKIKCGYYSYFTFVECVLNSIILCDDSQLAVRCTTEPS